MLEIGSIGTSAIMETAQQAIRLTDGLHCGCVYSRDPGRGAAFAGRMGIPKSCHTLEDLIRDPEIGAIYIASPNTLHPGQAIAAMAYSKHVLVEKPAAVTAGALEAMIRAAEENHVFFFECITTLFMPTYRRWKALLPELGQITGVDMRYGQYSSRMEAYRRGENPNNFNPEMGGGALNDLGIYCVHTAVDLFGVPEALSYQAKRGPNGVDLAGTLTLTYPGFLCRIHVAKDRDLDSGCTISGTRGTLESHGPLNSFSACSVSVNGGRQEFLLPPDENRMIYQFARFRDAIAANDSSFFRQMCRQSLAAARILEQAHGAC